MPKGAKLTLRPNMNFNQTMEMIENGFLKLRAKAIMRYVTHKAATTMLEETQDRIPAIPAYAKYRDSLHVVQSGIPSAPVFSVMGEATKEEQIEKDRDVLYIQPKKKTGKLAPEIEILMRYQPWTQDTLPFTVDPRKGKLIIRKVSAREVTAVAKARTTDKPKWSRELATIGVQPDPKKAKIPEGAKGTPDVAYTALRLEFGLGGTKAVAHWRPAIQRAKEAIAKEFKSGKFAKALLDWDNDEWKTWRDLHEKSVPSSVTENFSEFQDKIT